MKLGGKKLSVLGASRRIDSSKFREATGWAPAYPDAKVGLQAVAAAHQAACRHDPPPPDRARS